MTKEQVPKCHDFDPAAALQGLHQALLRQPASANALTELCLIRCDSVLLASDGVLATCGLLPNLRSLTLEVSGMKWVPEAPADANAAAAAEGAEVEASDESAPAALVSPSPAAELWCEPTPCVHRQPPVSRKLASTATSQSSKYLDTTVSYSTLHLPHGCNAAMCSELGRLGWRCNQQHVITLL